MLLNNEIDLFESKLDKFLKEHPSEFVVIKNNDINFFASKKAAIDFGLNSYGSSSHFLARQILKEQPKIRIPSIELGLL